MAVPRAEPVMPPPGWRRTMVEVKMVMRGATHAHLMLRSRLSLLVVSTLAFDAIATVFMYLFEHGNAKSGFDDVGGALFWVSAQLTTVSSQMPNPVTTPGRVLDIVLELWAISVVATLAGALGAFFHARHLDTEPGTTER